MKLSMFSLNTEILLEFLRLGKVFEKVRLCLNKGNNAHSSCIIWCIGILYWYIGILVWCMIRIF